MEAGGLVGMVDAGSLQISDSSMNGTINVDNSSSSYIAGLVGYLMQAACRSIDAM